MANNGIIVDKFHTFFIFPFRYDKLCREQLINRFCRTNHWFKPPYDLHEPLNYNEYLFFYPHLRDIIFFKNKDNKSIGYLQYKNIDDNSYYKVINNYQKDNSFELELKLKNICLHIFENSTAILVFEIINDKDYLLDAYLKFLDMGRRLYPSFIDPANDKITTNKIIISSPKNNALSALQCPTEIFLNLTEGNCISEDFKKFEFFDIPETHSLGLSTIIRKLLDCEGFLYEKGNYWPLVDDRMITHTYYSIAEGYNHHNRRFINSLKAYFNKNTLNNYDNADIELWFRMVFLDGNSLTCQNELMLQQLLNESTYKRWTNYGGFYGFSRYSSAFISNFQAVPYIKDHFETMYYQMAIILCFYRGSILSFSEKAKKISANILQSKNSKQTFKDMYDLQKSFLYFETKYWNKEITAQDQGIEIFDLWETKMKNNLLIQDLKNSITELNTYFNYIRDQRINNLLNFISIIGAFLLIVNIGIAIMGVNSDKSTFLFGYIISPFFLYWAGWIFMFICPIIIWIIYKIWKKYDY